MTYSNGSHGCKRTAQLLRIERDLAATEAVRRERHEEIKKTLSAIQGDLASFQLNSSQEIARFTKRTTTDMDTLRQDFDRRFRAVFARIDALSNLINDK